MPFVSKLNYSLYKSNRSLLILLTLFSCALLIDYTIANLVNISLVVLLVTIFVIIQFIDLKYSLASIFIILLNVVMRIDDFPYLPNHTTLELFISLLILIIFGRKILTGNGISTANISRCFRYSLVTIYFIAGFHKLNSGFFAISGSCSTYITQGLNIILFEEQITYPNIVVKLLQIGTIVIEMIIPFGILFHQTRKIAVWMLIIFHFYLSLCGIPNFSAFAAFLLAGCVLDLNQKPSSKLIKVIKVYILITVMASIAAFLFRKFSFSTPQFTLVVYGAIYNIGLIYLFYNLLDQELKSKSIYIYSLKSFLVPYVFVILIMIWGLQGYFGLSNTSTLTMFSNLVTEQSRSNHFIINTKYTKIWDFEEDYVTILRLPEQEMEWGRRYKIENYDLPLIEFKKIAKHWVRDNKEDLRCTIFYKDNIIYIDNLADSNFSKTEWWYKFLYYRRIPKKHINQCMW